MVSSGVNVPYHHQGQCQTTGCSHCSVCGLGPQYQLTYCYATNPYRYEADDRNYTVARFTNGCCQRCAS